jgi:hypothetical protein
MIPPGDFSRIFVAPPGQLASRGAGIETGSAPSLGVAEFDQSLATSTLGKYPASNRNLSPCASAGIHAKSICRLDGVFPLQFLL